MNWDAPAPELAPGPRPNAAGMDLEALKALVAGLGERPWRAVQIHQGLYRMRWTGWDAFTSLSKGLRSRLEAEVRLEWPALVDGATSADGSTKHAFRLEDGAVVEGVHMPYEDRTTLCLSSQVGCAMGCTFCATGQMGIRRNLTPGEIVGQVVAMLNAHAHPQGRPVNLVFMGMGEPLHNLDNLMKAFALLTDPEGLAIPPRRITVSTSGLVTGIRRLGAFRPRPRLALSLNATTDDYRSRIMPVNRVWGLEDLAAELSAFPLEAGERITLEYVLLKGVTDAPEDGRRLAAFASRFPAKVNLIPFNPHEGSGFQPPDEARISELLGILSAKGITASVRRSRGQDVAGACGQLAREQDRRG
ncbi:23S rRNA (adenine(2503)-C(2))-methyltransferase RlmN [Mesoterricola sediminis]|uniref:Probable dual-specificity RNA methyltransferase RlmN n=1 Tax=Mesoterricola sediminis TaxID=2927980 RepID=A0AA48KDR6_9BACT|nr:23S rRNA (adenine(2503)-C(2))-methyltransferase RlmN [Mesoterricola sediminis]BDU78486.1 dual-specificity RNA methyltransferase RlmN [Mesoterricola sediminis]